jgi:hypothetical protein
LLEVYDSKPLSSNNRWIPPSSNEVGWKGLSPEQLRDAIELDTEPVLQIP